MAEESRPVVLRIELLTTAKDDSGVRKVTFHKDTFYFSVPEAVEVINNLLQQIGDLEKEENSALTQAVETS